MFGQQTEVLQGSTANGLRPQVYRNIYQAYGSYTLPIAASRSISANSRARLVSKAHTRRISSTIRVLITMIFCPFTTKVFAPLTTSTAKVSLRYWLVNGANQTEDFNGFKSQAARLTFKPQFEDSWNINCYEGQEQRDVLAAYNPGIPQLPTHSGLSTTPVTNRHDGRFHVIDYNASFKFWSKWSATVEGDYVINRVAANSSPARVYGGVG